MSLTKPQLDALVALLSESLRARAGDVLDDLVIADRARNAAQLLDGCYDMRPRTEAGFGPVSNGVRAGVLTRKERDRVATLCRRVRFLDDRAARRSSDLASGHDRREGSALRWAIEIITGEGVPSAPAPGTCGICGVQITNAGASCSKGCVADDGRGAPLETSAPPPARYFTCRCHGAKHGALTGCSGTGADFTDGLCAYCVAECRGNSCGEAP